MTRRFSDAVRAELSAQGWRLAELPDALTLTSLRESGVPFKGDKIFARQRLHEKPLAASEVAYRPGLMPGSPNTRYDALAGLLDGFRQLVPKGADPVIGSAAAYGWLLLEHQRAHGERLLSRVLTWTRDEADGIHLAIGIFGGGLLVSPLPEGRGAGVGLLPVLLPRDGL